MYEITEFDLAEQHVELLPDREALALFNVNGILAANTAAAVNAFTVDSVAVAVANQDIDVNQS